MTNYATLRNWPLVVSLVDVARGTFLTGISAVIGLRVTLPIVQGS